MMFKSFFFIIITFYSANLLANKCNVDTKIMYSILQNESYNHKTIGYEYLISFNNSKDAKRVRKTRMKKFFLSTRTLDCFDEKICTNILEQLISAGITNLDLGAWQLNYKWHKLPLADYFKRTKGYLYACEYVESLIKSYGYNWYAIASYHSRTPAVNARYRKKLLINYNKL